MRTRLAANLFDFHRVGSLLLQQAHDFYQEVAEVKLLVDHMAEENREALIQAKDALGKETTTVDQREGLAEERRGNLQSAQAAVRRIEIEQIAMDCIRKGLDGTWEIKHICTEPMSQLDEEDLQVLENMEKNHFAADRMKTVSQQLLQLQTEVGRRQDGSVALPYHSCPCFPKSHPSLT
ncbi:kinesin-like protein KIN-14E isoform X3 [Arapaima gigas]